LVVHHGFVFYPTLLLIFAKVNPIKFFKAIAPAQLLAFRQVQVRYIASDDGVRNRKCELMKKYPVLYHLLR
jgi:hypothetical protein